MVANSVKCREKKFKDLSKGQSRRETRSKTPQTKLPAVQAMRMDEGATKLSVNIKRQTRGRKKGASERGLKSVG